jgi:hypothetical protein
MGLTLPSTPPGTQQVVELAMQRAQTSGRFAFSGVTGGAAAVVTPVAPHQVYSIGLNELAESRGLHAAKMVGWRTIILHGSIPVAAVDFTGGGPEPRNLKSVNQGPQVQSSASAISLAEGMSQVKEKDYEPRLLQISSIYLVSLWLHGAQEEIFIPLEPAPGDFKAYNVYSEDAFFSLATGLAKRRMQFDDRPKGTPSPSAAPIKGTPPATAGAA